MLIGAVLTGCAGYDVVSPAIPPRPEKVYVEPPPEPAGALRQLPPTAASQLDDYMGEFRSAYRSAGQPRILILFNRDMEDNDKETMKKMVKVQAGVTERNESSSGNVSSTTEGGAAAYITTGNDNLGDFSLQEFERIRESFESRFLDVPVKLVDRDTAVRIHGIDEMSVFSYPDLPEAQRSQVEGVKKYADILITVRVKRGVAFHRRVSGDQEFYEPQLVARAIQLSDSRIIGTATTDEPAPGDENPTAYPFPLVKRVNGVVLDLMQDMAAAWSAR